MSGWKRQIQALLEYIKLKGTYSIYKGSHRRKVKIDQKRISKTGGENDETNQMNRG